MVHTDQDKFQTIMATLAEAYSKKLSPQTVAIYWTALKPLAIEQVERAVKHCIRHSEHWPKPANLYKFAQDEAEAPTERSPLPEMPFGLRLVNQMFMVYLHQRRVVEGFKGDLCIAERRRACLDLAEWIDGMKAENMLPTLDECKNAFAGAMEQVKDRTDIALGSAEVF